MFGGSGGRESRPQYVQNEWSVATEFLKEGSPSMVRWHQALPLGPKAPLLSMPCLTM
jgi:hypothetical protein